MIILWGAVAFLGAAALFIINRLLFRAVALRMRWRPAVGTCVRHEWGKQGVVTVGVFVDPEGVEREVSNMDQKTVLAAVGDEIPVAYSPRNPANCEFLPLSIGRVFRFAFGAVVLNLGAVVILGAYVF
ncbi:DUF3592 domain-containing protein [Streptomyces sp. NPDC048577]|uniref:DUF3592 domain-containing protein n=1 Tax=Streptomyces sp. NPDC048577 TaxID=3157209 RepID=UPI00344AE6F0